MAGCDDVCIDMDYDEENAFYSALIRTARKEHKCCECGRTIRAGEIYEYVSGKTDGDVWTAKTCAECTAIRKALVCGTCVHGGLWEAIEDHGVFERWTRTSPIDCLAKVETLEARNVLRHRFTEWRKDYLD
jgi:hypothetical protein